MKTVYYIRHAKSSWADFTMQDVDRPLNERGQRDAPVMAKRLYEMVQEKGNQLDGIYSSYAQRTRETLIPFQEIFGLQEHTVVEKALYHASSETLVETLYGIDKNWNAILLFAHNPGISFLLGEISEKYTDNVPTCGIYKVIFDVEDWTEVDVDKANVEFFIYPKMFR